MKENGIKRSVSGVAALILLAIFAAGILSVLLTGADLYKRLSDRTAREYDSRTCVQYLTNKVRQAPSPEAIDLRDFGGSDCLVITELIDNETYETKIYCCDGWLWELFSAADSGLEPMDGSKILPLKGLSADISGDLLQLTFFDSESGEETVYLALRGKAAKP